MKLTTKQLRKIIKEEISDLMPGDPEEPGEESAEFAEAIAALETMHQNLEGIIGRLKEVPGAPLGTDIYMAHPGLDEQKK